MPALIKGKNDIYTVNEKLASEWNYERNGEITPSDIAIGSQKKVWWKCEKGHEWQATPHNRNYGTGCPYCSGRLPIKGENDLVTLFPDIAREWNFKKNQGLHPEDISYGSSKKVWWKCEKGHEWQSSLYIGTVYHKDFINICAEVLTNTFLGTVNRVSEIFYKLLL